VNAHLARLTGRDVRSVRVVGGQHGYQHLDVEFADGQHGFARMHAYGADSFGAPWTGYIAGLPLDNTRASSWPQWYAERRLAPFLRMALSSGALRAQDGALVETVMERLAELAGPAEPAARVHGDCWSGNVLWPDGRGWLIDPAAHGGHRETDLAMLALFGASYRSAVVEAAGAALQNC
jgi:fructosamine-3-kinase